VERQRFDNGHRFIRLLFIESNVRLIAKCTSCGTEKVLDTLISNDMKEEYARSGLCGNCQNYFKSRITFQKEQFLKSVNSSTGKYDKAKLQQYQLALETALRAFTRQKRR